MSSSLVGNLLFTARQGTLSALSLKEILKFLQKTGKIDLVGSFLLMNLFIFGGSLLARDFLLLPLFDLVAIASEVEPNETHKYVARTVFDTMLLIPMFVLSNVLNFIWCRYVVYIRRSWE
jgi:hypothetical protein